MTLIWNMDMVIRTGPKEPEVTLQVEVPAGVKRQLVLKAAQEGVTLRTLVLRALRGQGIQVDKNDIQDRRKQR